MMVYLVTRVRRAAEDHRAWTAVMGPEGNLELQASGPERRASLDPLDQLGQRVRKENLDLSLMATASRVYQVYQELMVNLVSEVLMVRLVSQVPEALKVTLVHLVLLDLQG